MKQLMLCFLGLFGIATVLFCSLHITSAQSSCSNPGTDHWLCGSTVYYSINGFSGSNQNAIINGIAVWNNLNSNQRVTFLPADGGHPSKYVFQAGNTLVANKMANTGWSTVSQINRTVVNATTVYYLNEHYGDSSAIYDPSNAANYQNMLHKVTLHEIGHTMSLEDTSTAGGVCNQTNGVSVMNGPCGTNDSANNMTTSISTCDITKLSNTCPVPTPTRTPAGDGMCGAAYNMSLYPQTGCPNGFTIVSSVCNRSSEFQDWCDIDGYSAEFCDCTIPSGGAQCGAPGGGCPYDGTWFSDECSCTEGMDPMLIDVEGDGFELTNRALGVDFDLNADGTLDHLSWTAGNSDDGFLSLDRNANGTIDNGEEVFGNVTPQPDPPDGTDKHGFLALAVFDTPNSGGNNDGKISILDAIFSSLRVWQDVNHNGFSESSELLSLTTAGIKSIDLDFKLSKKIDQYGNKFRYRTKITTSQNSNASKWAWDVILLMN